MTDFELHDLTLRRGQRFTLGPLRLSIGAAERVAVIGPSGCGKTTLLRLLAGLERPSDGSITHGEVAWSRGKRVLVPPARRKLGVVFQDGALWPHLDAVQHLRFVDPALSRADAERLLARVGLAARVDHRPEQLSGGERQRLALARALAGAPELLLLDEPLHSVDVHLRAELGLLIRTVAEERGIGLILVTHDRDEALAIADRLVVMHDGAIVEEGDAGTLLRAPQTAFTASFLCGAACLPAEAEADGLLHTLFGAFPPANGGPRRLVVLPGDARVVGQRNGRPSCEGRVLRVTRGVDGAMAMVAVGAHVLQAWCGDEVHAGDEVCVALTEPPRLLPAKEIA